jgi:hypothetical protein
LVRETAAILKEFVKPRAVELFVANQSRQEQNVEFSLLIRTDFVHFFVGIDSSDKPLGCERVDLSGGILGCGPDIGHEIDNISRAAIPAKPPLYRFTEACYDERAVSFAIRCTVYLFQQTQVLIEATRQLRAQSGDLCIAYRHGQCPFAASAIR